MVSTDICRELPAVVTKRVCMSYIKHTKYLSFRYSKDNFVLLNVQLYVNMCPINYLA